MFTISNITKDEKKLKRLEKIRNIRNTPIVKKDKEK
mgnify:CR=1 FL=1|jgi:hypothetical protein|tara:strand:- start:726 stop:833 length:108 start_codon:yes stop_codon:yes gene_type:complete